MKSDMTIKGYESNKSMRWEEGEGHRNAFLDGCQFCLFDHHVNNEKEYEWLTLIITGVGGRIRGDTLPRPAFLVMAWDIFERLLFMSVFNGTIYAMEFCRFHVLSHGGI